MEMKTPKSDISAFLKGRQTSCKLAISVHASTYQYMHAFSFMHFHDNLSERSSACYIVQTGCDDMGH